jgi:hypothetical protein
MRLFKLNRNKSEAPMVAAFSIFSIVVSLVTFPAIIWYSFLVFPIMAIIYMVLRKFRLGFFKQECFLILDGEGLRYSFTVIQRPRILKWEQVDKVNYQLYEINFKLKETGEIISMQTGYLENEAEISDLKAYIETQCQMM